MDDWRCGHAGGTAPQFPGRRQGKQEGNLEGSDQEIPHPAEEDKKWEGERGQCIHKTINVMYIYDALYLDFLFSMGGYSNVSDTESEQT